MDWNKRINKALLAALRATAHNGIDPVTKRTITDIKQYIAWSIPCDLAHKSRKALRKIERLELLTRNSTG
jgi:hypothetical protein